MAVGVSVAVRSVAQLLLRTSVGLPDSAVVASEIAGDAARIASS